MSVTNRNIHQVIALIRRAMRDLPDPSVTLVGKKWRDPYLVLISCLLSLRTKDETTLPASERLFNLAKTPADMARLKIEAIEDAIYPVGFYRTKARTVQRVSREILERFNGEVPRTLEDLMSFKGVGRKTANLVLIEGFHIPAMCVDTHVHRISNRLGYVKTQDPHQTEWALREKLPRLYWAEYNALLVTWGQNVCKPVSPFCSQCPVNHLCARKGVTKSR
ncbi:MAG TPA: endonuclease III [Candidatus Omnitrophota bacterium]|nr:endonuclease III [Candidatus Omnitrophota bacterium]HQO58234.1 endonuclease III [Candidatus Omnitrophota bacterium]HQP11890.1 endonuclease III [Candidatus Omnitrophota bacterium]